MVSELSVWLLSSNKVSKKSHMASNLLESVSDLLEVYLSLTYKKVYLNSQNGLWHIRKCLRTLRLASDLSESAIIWFYAYLNSYIFFLDDSKCTWCYWVGCHRWLILPSQVTSLWHRFGHMTPWFSLCALCKGGHVVPLQFSKGIVQTLF